MEGLLIGVKNLISFVFYHTKIQLLVNRWIRQYYGKLPVVNVLCYHGVTKRQASLFERQLDYLSRKGYFFLSGQELIVLINDPKRFRDRRKYVCLTFDDCYEDNYLYVRPILSERRIPAIFFAVSSKLDKTADWPGGNNGKLMSASQLKEMALQFDIGSHTCTHVRLAKVVPEQAQREVERSKSELTAMLQRPIVFLAYPNGDYNALVTEIVEGCGFQAAFTVEQHCNYQYGERFILGRYLVDPDDFESFKLKVAGGHDWVYFLRLRLRRLFHSRKIYHRPGNRKQADEAAEGPSAI